MRGKRPIRWAGRASGGFTYGGTPGSVIYHMFGNMARTDKLYP